MDNFLKHEQDVCNFLKKNTRFSYSLRFTLILKAYHKCQVLTNKIPFYITHKIFFRIPKLLTQSFLTHKTWSPSTVTYKQPTNRPPILHVNAKLFLLSPTPAS